MVESIDPTDQYSRRLNSLYARLEEALEQNRDVTGLVHEIKEVSNYLTNASRACNVLGIGALHTDYHCIHRPPVNDGDSPILVSSANHLLGLIRDNLLDADKATRRVLAMLTMPHAPTTIPVYRAIPEQHHCLNQGDWVTLSRNYAELHAEAYLGDTPLVVRKFMIPTDHLYTSEDSANELGFCSLGVKSTLYFKL